MRRGKEETVGKNATKAAVDTSNKQDGEANRKRTPFSFISRDIVLSMSLFLLLLNLKRWSMETAIFARCCISLTPFFFFKSFPTNTSIQSYRNTKSERMFGIVCPHQYWGKLPLSLSHVMRGDFSALENISYTSLGFSGTQTQLFSFSMGILMSRGVWP